MNIRQFRDDDGDEVIALWRLCGLCRPWNDPTKDIQRKQAVQPELFLVGEQDGAIIATAMAGYDGHRGSLYYLAMAPDYQRHGYGRQLMKAVEDRLLALGCPKLNILVRTGNMAVLDFYGRLGYTPDDVSSIGKRLIPD